MDPNFITIKVHGNGMIGIHRKNSAIMLRATEVQGVIQDLIYARKAATKAVDPRIIDEMNIDVEKVYLKTLADIVVKLLINRMYNEVYQRCMGCRDEEPNQQAHEYCLEVDPVTKANDCFTAVFEKIDLFFANELCFEKVKDTIPIPVRDTDLYQNREKLLRNLDWIQNLREKFVEAYANHV